MTPDDLIYRLSLLSLVRDMRRELSLHDADAWKAVTWLSGSIETQSNERLLGVVDALKRHRDGLRSAA